MPTVLHMSLLISTLGVESCARKEPRDADYLKASWLFCLIVNHSVECVILTNFHKTHHGALFGK